MQTSPNLSGTWPVDHFCRHSSMLTSRACSIVRLLNGRHHLDEIRYRSQLSRKQLQTALAAFDEHLVFFHHP